MLPRKLDLLLHRAESVYWERRFGIGTRVAGQPGRDDDEHSCYQPSAYRSIFKVLDALDLQPSDVFVELGCGKGRVTCCAAMRNVARVIGVEDMPELAAIAEENARRMRGRRRPVRIIAGNAEGFDFREGTVFYMFNSFGPETLRRVLAKIERGVLECPRAIRIAYLAPMHEGALGEASWLRRVGAVRTIEGEASIWSSREVDARPLTP